LKLPRFIEKNEKSQKTVDIKLSNFVASLTEVPSRELEALQERAVESGFDFIDFWAVDFDWRPGQPFNHHWQDYRTPAMLAQKTRRRMPSAELVRLRSALTSHRSRPLPSRHPKRHESAAA
jgi:hypothetical protein